METGIIVIGIIVLTVVAFTVNALEKGKKAKLEFGAASVLFWAWITLVVARHL